MLGELIPCGGGHSFPLLQSRIVVGRHPDCDVCLRFKSVSARHCELTFRRGRWTIRDLGSRNGTGVNGVRSSQKQLQPHDVLSFGNQRYSIVYALAGESQPGSTVLEDEEDLAFRFLDEVSPKAASDPPLPRPQPATDQEPPRSPTRTPVKQKPRTRPRPAAGPQPAKSRPPRTYMGKLVPCGGGSPIPLLGQDLLVGRKSHCDVQIKSSTVSGEHCRLKFEEGYWFVYDLGSSNGINVDGMSCQSKCLLPECTLSISTHRYEIIYTPTEDAPPPEQNPFAQGLLEKLGLEDQVHAEEQPQWLQVDDGQVSSKKWTLDETEDVDDGP